MTIGEKILKLRQDKGFSQKELAELIEKKTSDIAMWESDEEIPSIIDVNKLCLLFGVTSDYLINDADLSANHNQNEVIEPCIVPEKANIVSEKNVPNKSKKKSKKIILFCVIVLFLIVAGFVILFVSKASFSNNTKAIEQATESVVKVFCYDIQGEESATGSGFVCFDDSTIITNYHVIEDANTCRVSTEEDKTFEIENVICYSQEFDIAIIKTKEKTGLKPLKIGESDSMKKGETVVAIGSPLGIKNSVSKGVLSGRVMEDNMDVLQFTAEISRGSSGGALFNNKGDVIGVTYASYENGQDINLAVPIEKAVETYDNRKEPIDLSSVYLLKYPYAKYLKSFNDAVDVSLSELKDNPQFYKGKKIKVTGYVSSSENGVAQFLTDNEEDISGDINYDLDDYIYNDFSDSHTAFLSGNPLYEDENIQPGDKVCIIGNFAYITAGSNLYNHLIEEEGFITFDDNKGHINITIMYKISDEE